MVEHSASHLVDAHLLFSSEAQDVNSILFSKEVSTQNIITLENTLRSAVLILQLINKLLKYFKVITHICGFQLNFVINAGHSDLTLAAHGEVIGVGCDKCQICRSERVDKLIRLLQNKTVSKFNFSTAQCVYQSAQVCGWSSSGRRCGSLFHREAGMTL